eukprot:m.134244 g.134244  ORF g.134244 m.134244 type:complete len:186 (-) comp15973_c0_seq2:1314-1871(-)
MLNLQVPVNIKGVAFVPQSNGTKVITVSAHRHVRLYDTALKKRPIYSVEPHDRALSCVCVASDGKRAVVGDVAGNVTMLDVETGRAIGNFKGHAGSVRDVVFHTSENMVATVSLDRNVRLFNAGTRQLIRKIYTKQRLNCVALTSEPYEAAVVAKVTQALLKRRTSFKPCILGGGKRRQTNIPGS